MTKDALIYADHILEAIANVESDIAGHDFESFRADRRTRQLAERNIEIVSEASRRLPEHLKEAEARIPWEAIAGIGNVLRHDYHKSDPAVLWQTCTKDLPPLKAAVRRIRRKLERPARR